LPIDFVNTVLPLKSFEEYKCQVPFLDWHTAVNTDTGEQVQEKTKRPRKREDKKGRYTYQVFTHTANYNCLHLTVKEIHRRFNKGYTGKPLEYVLEIAGSLHKNHHGYNHGRFTFSDLETQLNELEQVLKIPLHIAEIKTIETGVNVTPIISADEITNNVHTLGGRAGKQLKIRPFYYYRPKHFGGYFSTDRYKVKIYNKGAKHSLPFELLRYELRFEEMGILKSYGIKTLADLKDRAKVMQLKNELLKVWEQVVLYDSYAERNAAIKKTDKEFLNEVMRRDFWEIMRGSKSRTTFCRKKKRLRAISAKYGKDLHKETERLFIAEWQNLFKVVTFADGGRNPHKKESSNVCGIKIKGANVTTPSGPEKRYCFSCGRDISQQKTGSKFCSEKVYGKEAKKCRNKDSNSRNNRKKKIIRRKRKGLLLFEIEPYIQL
jgi:hypothetical protein